MKNLYAPVAYCCNKSIFFILLLISFSTKAQELMRANLYVVDANGATLVDGNLTNYNNVYSNNVDINDGWKMPNPGINFSIYRTSIDLVVERRSIYLTSDTTFFRMWNMPQANFRIKFMLKNLNHPGMQAIVKDSYKGTETAIGLNDTSFYNFTVDANPASSANMRFQLIYTASVAAPLEVNFTGITAVRKATDVALRWNVAGETAVQSYVVEHSYDGRNFTELKTVIPGATGSVRNSYDYSETGASATSIFYRIKAVSERSGRVQYSSIAKIGSINAKGDINLFPTQVTNKMVQVQFIGQPEGEYKIAVLSGNGIRQQLPSVQIHHLQTSFSLNLPQNLAPGLYYVAFTGPSKSGIIKSIIVL